MNVKAIHGKILAVTKHYFFQQPPDIAYQMSFFSGSASPFSGVGLEWWIDTRGGELREQLARMIIEHIPALADGEPEDIVARIQNFLQDNALNPELFDRDLVLLHGNRNGERTLFEARSCTEQEFAARLWRGLETRLTQSIVPWLVLYPVPRLTLATHIEAHDVRLFSSNDRDTWQSMVMRFPKAQEFDPIRATSHRRGHDILLAQEPPESWLASEVTGTARGAKNLACRQFREFVAVLFACLQDTTPTLLMKSMAPTLSFCTQIPQDPVRAQHGRITSSSGVLLPPFPGQIAVAQAVAYEMKTWYSERLTTSGAKRKRSAAAAQFIHYAIVADGLERFIHFFIALDALFGVRNDVERTIINGVARTFPSDDSWRDRTEKLFALRSEFVHGGCSRIGEWRGLNHYRSNFQSDPLRDVSKAALNGFRSFFSSP
jgi:hypothetical protein